MPVRGVLSLFLLFSGPARADELANASTASTPVVAPASPEAERALKLIRVPKGLRLDLFAAEPMLANPVAFCFDERGRVYAVETFRLHHGVTDNRKHMDWLDADLAARTVADRVAMYRKFLGTEAADYAKETDRVRLLEDLDGDGKADRATVFADGFHHIEEGLAAGVLARRGEVYLTNIPHLWKLRDTDGDGKADVRQSLHDGFGVHVAFLGHDLHGLKFGPDGKLYFSIGDRGLNVATKEGKTLFAPDTGSVLRCDPDGANLEIVATGLRNPQELVFDPFGNLFTVDNNSDSGDKARVVYLVEGSDSGWRIGYQYLTEPVSRGPWNAEKLWHPRWDGQAAYIVPPLANLGDGPSGLTIEPGTSQLPDQYRHHFFLCDFRGAAGQSGVREFSVAPKGASFEVVGGAPFLWGLEATDVDFGPDGALYVSDWVEGWGTTGKGRLVKLSDPARANDPKLKAVKALLAEDFTKRSIEDLTALLAHADMRVRQEAQFALAERNAVEALRPVAERGTNRFARLHAIWGLGQIGRKDDKALDSLVGLLTDVDATVRAQAAKVLGDDRHLPAGAALVERLGDQSALVRSLAAIALGKLAHREAIPALLNVLRENADRDPALRHAAVMGLVGCAEGASLDRAGGDPSPSVRMGVLLADRRLGRGEAARFLDDADPRIVTEAARAIYDAPIASALPNLAALTERSGLDEPAYRRALNARARLGRADDARGLARLSARGDVPEPIRVEALARLRDWNEPIGRDPVDGLWRPRDARSSADAAAALKPFVPNLLGSGPEAVVLATLKALGAVRVEGAGEILLALVAPSARSSRTRVEAIKALERLDDPRLGDAVGRAVTDQDAAVRIEGQRLLAKVRPLEALPVLTGVLDRGSIAERQGAFATIGTIPGAEADRLLVRWLGRLGSGQGQDQVPPEVELDLLDAARGRATSSPELAEALRKLDEARPKDDPVAAYREALAGGNAERGAKLVKEKTSISCLRCHKVQGQGGEVGPDLTGLGARHDRRYILEAIVAPNRQIAQGFETLVLALADGQVVSGILKADDGQALRLVTAEGTTITVPKADIEEQKRGVSAMPEDVLRNLTRAELRDVVEFLATVQ